MKYKIACIAFTIIVIALIVGLLSAYILNRNVARSGSWCRQIALACLAYPSQASEEWPPSIEHIVKWSDGELDEVWKRINKEKLHYFKPTPSSRSNQPVLVYEQETLIGVIYVIAYCDGHIGTTRDNGVVKIGKTLVSNIDYYDIKSGVTSKDWDAARGSADW